MGSQEHRLRKLEEKSGLTAKRDIRSVPPSGRISLNYDPLVDRPIHFHFYGFDLEPLQKAPAPPVPRRVPTEPHLLPIVRAYYNQIAETHEMLKKLKDLPRANLLSQAERLGYRIVFPETHRAGDARLSDD